MKKVALLFGGNSYEHEISCLSAKEIVSHYNQKKYQIDLIGISKDLKFYFYLDDLLYLEDGSWIERKKKEIKNIIETLKTYDVIFPITHGAYGEDGKLQGLLEFTGVPYVGSKTLGSAISFHKEINKKLISYNNIKILPFLSVTKETKIKDITSKFKFPMIIKPCSGGSSIGIKKVTNKKELKEGLKYAFQYDEELIIEPFLKVQELECAILENKKILVSKVGEILPSKEYYDYDAKYKDSKSKTRILTDSILTKQIQELSQKIYFLSKAKGYARIDFFYDGKELYFNEINTIPGFTTISMYPILWEDISYQDLISILIEHAFNE